MKARRLWVGAVLFVCCVVFLPMKILGVSDTEKGQRRLFARSTLEGARKMNLDVSVYGDAEKVSAQALQTEVAWELGKAGIAIVEDANIADGCLNIIIYVKEVKELPLYVVSVEMSFDQAVALVRDPTIKTIAATWPASPDAAWVSCVGELQLVESIKKRMTEQTRKFCNDYLTANPKQTEKKARVSDKDRVSGIPAEFAHRYTWMLCRNPACRNSWQISLQEYYEMVEKFRTDNPGLIADPAAACPKCGESSGYIAVKCEKCGLIFEKGTVPRDFEDRCPKCKFSKIEQLRVERAKRTPK